MIATSIIPIVSRICLQPLLNAAGVGPGLSVLQDTELDLRGITMPDGLVVRRVVMMTVRAVDTPILTPTPTARAHIRPPGGEGAMALLTAGPPALILILPNATRPTRLPCRLAYSAGPPLLRPKGWDHAHWDKCIPHQQYYRRYGTAPQHRLLRPQTPPPTPTLPCRLGLPHKGEPCLFRNPTNWLSQYLHPRNPHGLRSPRRTWTAQTALGTPQR